ncbi:MAG: glycosyltransferase family 9 protein, partial [Veillonella sp.]
MKDYKNILIIKMSSLGDVIHALPTLYAVRKNWPNARITWAIHE